ncbi:MAG: hypothetical protein QY332_10765 [Anaerolineales bacterium]|nr:MAG: hypothetical protein QY332_10765 [Anaerolineales bacterium]
MQKNAFTLAEFQEGVPIQPSQFACRADGQLTRLIKPEGGVQAYFFDRFFGGVGDELTLW